MTEGDAGPEHKTLNQLTRKSPVSSPSELPKPSDMPHRLLLPLALALALLLHAAHGAYQIGIGKADITGPAAEVVMMGYAATSQTTAGILNRLYARAFVVLDTDTNERVLFVNCDLQGVFQLVHQEVIAELKGNYSGLYTEQNTVLHATHTHASPGGASAYFLYDVSIWGFISENYNQIVAGIMKAIAAAHDSMATGTIRYNEGTVAKGGKNRSPLAYLFNSAAERALYSGDIDTTLRMMQFLDASGSLRGLLAFYPVHPTSLNYSNHLISGDNKGYAEFVLETKYSGIIAAIGISNAADVSPNRVDNGDGTFSGEGVTDIESAEIIGQRQADTVISLLGAPSELVTGPVLGRLSYVNFSNVTLKGVAVNASDPYNNRTCPAVVGQNFAAGTEDGRGVSGFTEGSMEGNPFYKAVGTTMKSTPDWLKDCQTREKVPLLATGLMEPMPWTPEILPVQVLKIGQIGLGVTNFEVSTMSGRRIRSTLKSVLASAGITHVEIVSISNAYAQYLTTKEEYSAQHYEGASTLFGPNQLAAVQQEIARVAASVVDPSAAFDMGPTPRQFNRDSLITLQPGVVYDSAGLFEDFGALRTDASSSYKIGDTVAVSFYGGHPKNSLSSVSSFCDVEKLTSGSTYATVMTDAHWDLRYHWARVGVAGSNSTCEWYIRSGASTTLAGTYRIRHRGYSKSLLGKISAYEGVSSPFAVSS